MIKHMQHGSPENRNMRLRAVIRTLIELSRGDDHLFLLNKYNSITIDGKSYTIKLSED